jgi:HrpA-like RNA helicase
MASRHLEEYPVPEMRRVSLEDVCLQCLFLELGDPEEFLLTCLEPPSQEQVRLLSAFSPSPPSLTLPPPDH